MARTPARIFPSVLMLAGVALFAGCRASSSGPLLSRPLPPTPVLWHAETVVEHADDEILAEFVIEPAERPTRHSPVVVRLDVGGETRSSLVVIGSATEYRLFSGPLRAGPTRLELIQSDPPPTDAARVRILRAEFKCARAPEALRWAPILRGRLQWNPPGRHVRRCRPLTDSDLPLLAFYTERPTETGREYTYSMIWSNEDGGTGMLPPLLMARYGRMVDIEWTYRVEVDQGGNIVREEYHQGPHRTAPFTGRRIGSHPVLGVANDFNTLTDREVEEWMRQDREPLFFALAPVPWDGAGPRERLLDERPWIVRRCEEELVAERKCGPEGVLDPRSIKLIGLRDYVYMEAEVDAPASARWSFGVRAGVGADGAWSHSDHSLPLLRYEQSGWGRTAIKFPLHTGRTRIEEISAEVFGFEPGQTARIESLTAFRLNGEFAREETIFELTETAEFTPGQPRRVLRTDLPSPDR
ncbi:MAG: hypothetical protein HYY93_01235 [Planctomycetes bacterium]|nr:hypothetical protein [Planctomycetota bacterium]